MIQSKVYQLLRSLSSVEQREARKFLVSPFFNQREDLVNLFDYLLSSKKPVKTTAWTKMGLSDKSFDDQKLRLYMSYLHRLLEQYLIQKERSGNEVEAQLTLAKAYRRRGLSDSFDQVNRNLQKALQKRTLRDEQFFEINYELSWEAHQVLYGINPTDTSMLSELSKHADAVFVIRKLRIICLITAHHSVYQSAQYADGWEQPFIRLAEQMDLPEYPAIQVYLHCYRMLRHPEVEDYFMRFKHALLEDSGRFSSDEMHSLYIWAINFCVRKLNEGEDGYFKEALDLYKGALEQDILLKGGHLSRFTYHNIVAAGLHTGALDWVRYFINTYKGSLEKKYRESSFSFNLARLEYASKNYDYVLELLQKANYRDPLLNLAAKTLLLKTYFDLNEFDLLQSHLDAMRNYIHRKRVLGYHRSNYLNIIRYSEKILRLSYWDKTDLTKLRKQIEQEKVLTERAFFLKVLDVFQ